MAQPQQIRLQICTWNVGNAPPPQNLTEWLGPAGCDLLVVGVQESTYAKRGERRKMVYSHMESSKPYTRKIEQVQKVLNRGHDIALVQLSPGDFCCVCSEALCGTAFQCSKCQHALHVKCLKRLHSTCVSLRSAAIENVLTKSISTTHGQSPNRSAKSCQTGPKESAELHPSRHRSQWHTFKTNKSPAYCAVCGGWLFPGAARQCSQCHVTVHQSCESILVTSCGQSQQASAGAVSTSHAFAPKTFYRPTLCAVCHEAMWGLRRQSQQCQKCGIKAHSHCGAWVVAECGVNKLENSEPGIPLEDMAAEQRWTSHLDSCVGPDMIPVAAVQLVGIRLAVYATKEVVLAIKRVVTEKEPTGVAGVVGNKGGCMVVIELMDRQLGFVACHLAAHEGVKYRMERNENIQEIMREFRLGSHGLDIQYECDHLFWLGDLNYRLDLAYCGDRGDWSHVVRWRRVKAMVDREEYGDLMACDELRQLIGQGHVLTRFQEGPLTFMPTFKVERRKETVYLEKRVAAYCDRILWHSLPGQEGEVEETMYGSVPAFDTSDHKPVHASFVLNFKQPGCSRTQPLGLVPGRGDLSSDADSHVTCSGEGCSASYPGTPETAAMANGCQAECPNGTYRRANSANAVYLKPGLQPPRANDAVARFDRPCMKKDVHSIGRWFCGQVLSLELTMLLVRLDGPCVDSKAKPGSGVATTVYSLLASPLRGEKAAAQSLSLRTSLGQADPASIANNFGEGQEIRLWPKGAPHHDTDTDKAAQGDTGASYVPFFYVHYAGAGTHTGSQLLPAPKAVDMASQTLQWLGEACDDRLGNLVEAQPVCPLWFQSACITVMINKVSRGQQHSCYGMAAVPLAPLASAPAGKTVQLGPVPLTKSTQTRGSVILHLALMP